MRRGPLPKPAGWMIMVSRYRGRRPISETYGEKRASRLLADKPLIKYGQIHLIVIILIIIIIIATTRHNITLS